MYNCVPFCKFLNILFLFFLQAATITNGSLTYLLDSSFAQPTAACVPSLAAVQQVSHYLQAPVSYQQPQFHQQQAYQQAHVISQQQAIAPGNFQNRYMEPTPCMFLLLLRNHNFNSIFSCVFGRKDKNLKIKIYPQTCKRKH